MLVLRPNCVSVIFPATRNAIPGTQWPLYVYMTVSCCISCDGLPLITTTPPEINVDFLYITTYSNIPLGRVSK
jgi:hypothetical protein